MAKGDEFKPRRAEAGQKFDYNDADGKLVHLTADDDGIVTIKNDAQRRAADAFGLSEARIEKKSSKSERRAAARAARATAPTETSEAGKAEENA